MKKITIQFKYVGLLSYLYILLPIILFFINWLKFYIGFGASALLVLGFVWIMKNDILKNDDMIELPLSPCILSFAVIAVWVAYSGLGGYFYQMADNHWRNAIFRDLIDYSWPVIYPETNNALIYYFNFWLVPALAGKLFGWSAANLALYIWGLLGIVLIYLNIINYIKPKRNWHIILTAVFIIAWSGENVVGMAVSNMFRICNHNIGFGTSEGWLDFSRNGYDCSYLYRSNIDALCQVYNQAIVPWLAACMALVNPKTRTFAFVGLCALGSGPIPFIGLLPVFICLSVKEMIPQVRQHNFRYMIKEAFSLANIAACITIFPIMWLFFKSNISFSEANAGSFADLAVPLTDGVILRAGTMLKAGAVPKAAMARYIDWYVPWEAYDLPRVMTLLLFYFLEFGIYMIFIWKKYKKDGLFWTILATLVVIPLFKIGYKRDFCMNASLPALLILMVYTEKYIIDGFRENYSFKEALNYITLIIVLCVSTTTLINDFASKSWQIIKENRFPYVADDVGTLSDKDACEALNFLSSDWENTIFFSRLAPTGRDKD